MSSVPEHCTRSECDETPWYTVSNKLGIIVDYTCLKHTPFKDECCECEVIDDGSYDVRQHQAHFKAGFAAVPECAICWEIGLGQSEESV